MTNRSISLAMFAAVILGSTFHADGAVLLGPVQNPANGHLYYLLERDTWTASESFALTLGGHLATVNDAAENAWIVSTFGVYHETQRHLWIGINDAAVEGTFEWTSGEPVTYTNWGPGEPNNGFGIEDYGHIVGQQINALTTGTWNDVKNDAGNNPDFLGVAEVVPEPTLAAALVPMSIASARRRPRRPAPLFRGC